MSGRLDGVVRECGFVCVDLVVELPVHTGLRCSALRLRLQLTIAIVVVLLLLLAVLRQW